MNSLFELAIEKVTSPIHVVSIDGREWVSRLFVVDVQVEVATNNTHGFVAQVIGAAAELRVLTEDGAARRIAGVVSHAKALSHVRTERSTLFQLRIRPSLWLTKKGKNSRVFQEQTVREIVDDVLHERGIAFAWRLDRSYPKRPYCVQYQESDYQFVRRLLAEDGIYYFFEDPGKLVLADSAEAVRPLPSGSVLLYRAQVGLQAEADGVRSLVPKREVAETTATVRNFDYRRPNVDFTAHMEARGGRHSIEVYDFRYEVEEDDLSAHRAETLLKQQRRLDFTVEARSNCRRLAVGRSFRLADHADPALDAEYTIICLAYQGHVTGLSEESRQADGVPDRPLVFDATMICLPAGVCARPRRRKRRLHQVVESAVVTGPDGEEIHVDEMGRIKVQFHWDRVGDKTDRSSCWLRSTQPWAGAAWGSQFIPRVGMEVLVAFVAGDTDQPVVIGSLYNGSSPVPFALPANKTQSGIRTASTPGGQGSNELRFEDAAGKEQIYLHAQRDLDEHVGHDHRRAVIGAERVEVGKDRKLQVGGNLVRTIGGHEVTSIEKSRIVHVLGKQLIEVDGAADDDERSEAAPPPPEVKPEAVAPDPRTGVHHGRYRAWRRNACGPRRTSRGRAPARRRRSGSGGARFVSSARAAARGGERGSTGRETAGGDGEARRCSAPGASGSCATAAGRCVVEDRGCLATERSGKAQKGRQAHRCGARAHARCG